MRIVAGEFLDGHWCGAGAGWSFGAHVVPKRQTKFVRVRDILGAGWCIARTEWVEGFTRRVCLPTPKRCCAAATALFKSAKLLLEPQRHGGTETGKCRQTGRTRGFVATL